MILGFRDKATEKIWNLIQVRSIPVEIQKIGLRKLTMLNGAKDIYDLRIPPSNHLEKLKKDREGQYSIRINDQWRICFIWENGNAFEVEIVDYH
jgi:proteic killer suppression protein